MTDDLVARLRNEGDDEAVEALRFQEASIRRLERKLAAAEAKEHESFQQYVDANEARIDAEARVRELEAELADQKTIATYNREQADAAERKLAEAPPSATDELAALRAALEPFAKEADAWADTVSDDHRSLCTEPGSKTAHPGSETIFTVGDLRRARELLNAYDSGKLTAAPGDPEVIARIISRAMLDNPVDGEFSERVKCRMELAQSYADEVLSLLARPPAKPEAAE